MWKGRSYRKAHCGKMAHHHLTRSYRVPRARFPDESLPCDSPWRVSGLVDKRNLLLGHQGFFHLSPRHQSLRAGQQNRRRIRVGKTRYRLKNSFSSANRAVAQNPSRSCLSTSTTIMPKSVESGRSFSSLSAPKCRKSTLTWWPVISTEQPGANLIVTTLNLLVFERKHLPTQTFRCRLAPTPLWGPGTVPGEWTDVCGFVKPAKSHDVWKIRPPRETLGRRQRDQSCHHEVSNRYAHEPRGNYEQSSSRKGPAPTRLPKRKVGTTMKATIRCLLCHPFVSSCFHKQQVRRVKATQP